MIGRRVLLLALLVSVAVLPAAAQDEIAVAEAATDNAAPPAPTSPEPEADPVAEPTPGDAAVDPSATPTPRDAGMDGTPAAAAPASPPAGDLAIIAVAQPEPGAPGSPSETPDGATHLDEIVVTAQKRAQRLVDVPINVSSLSRDDIQATRIEQVRDVAAYVPNLDIKEQVPGAIPVVSIRGVGLDDFSSTNSPAAGVYVDGVTLSSLALMSFDMYDIERIEVLKGPQGTLYGRNSTAGAINVLSAKPTLDKEGFLRAGAGNYKTSDLEAMVNFPFGDFGIRFAGKLIRQGEGYWQSRSDADDPHGVAGSPGNALLGIPLPGGQGLPPLAFGTDTTSQPIKRDVGKRDIQMGRVRVGWDATPYLRLDLKVEGQRQRSEMGQPEGFGSLCQPGFTAIDPDHCTDALGYSDRDRDPYRGDWRGEFPYNVDQLGETLGADWDLGFGTLSSVTGYLSLRRFFHIDVDGAPADEFDFFQADTVRQGTQELRLAGTTGPAEWLAGVFGSWDRIIVSTDGFHEDLIPGEFSHIDADQTTRSQAAFANVDWHLAERWTLVSGLRYTREGRRYVGGTQWTVNVPNTVEDTFIDSQIRDINWSWKLGGNFAPTHKTLIYANASKGVKSGGYFSGVTSRQVQLEPYRPEHLTAYEIGFKRQGALSFNTSVFYYDYKDVQTFERSNTAPVQLIGNVSKANTYGLDFESTWRALDGWLEGLTTQVGVGLLRSRLGAFPSPNSSPVPGSPATEVPAGNKLANAPSVTFNGLLRYEAPLFSTGVLSLWQVDTHYASSMFKEATNDPLIESRPYWVWNARAGVTSAERTWEVALWGRNLTNELYVVQGLDIGAFFFGNHNYNAPRTAGVDVSVHF